MSSVKPPSTGRVHPGPSFPSEPAATQAATTPLAPTAARERAHPHVPPARAARQRSLPVVEPDGEAPTAPRNATLPVRSSTFPRTGRDIDSHFIPLEQAYHATMAALDAEPVPDGATPRGRQVFESPIEESDGESDRVLVPRANRRTASAVAPRPRSPFEVLTEDVSDAEAQPAAQRRRDTDTPRRPRRAASEPAAASSRSAAPGQASEPPEVLWNHPVVDDLSDSESAPRRAAAPVAVTRAATHEWVPVVEDPPSDTEATTAEAQPARTGVRAATWPLTREPLVEDEDAFIPGMPSRQGGLPPGRSWLTPDDPQASFSAEPPQDLGTQEPARAAQRHSLPEDTLWPGMKEGSRKWVSLRTPPDRRHTTDLATGRGLLKQKLVQSGQFRPLGAIGFPAPPSDRGSPARIPLALQETGDGASVASGSGESRASTPARTPSQEKPNQPAHSSPLGTEEASPFEAPQRRKSAYQKRHQGTGHVKAMKKVDHVAAAHPRLMLEALKKHKI